MESQYEIFGFRLHSPFLIVTIFLQYQSQFQSRFVLQFRAVTSVFIFILSTCLCQSVGDDEVLYFHFRAMNTVCRISDEEYMTKAFLKTSL